MAGDHRPLEVTVAWCVGLKAEVLLDNLHERISRDAAIGSTRGANLQDFR